jgi:ABC-type microcin C transport system permease subunit YejB
MASRETKKQIEELINNLLSITGKNDALAFEGAVAFKISDGSIYASNMPESVDIGIFTVETAEAFKHSINAGKAAGRTGSSIILLNSIIVAAYFIPAMLLAVLVSPGQNYKPLIPEVEKTAELIKKIM